MIFGEIVFIFYLRLRSVEKAKSNLCATSDVYNGPRCVCHQIVYGEVSLVRSTCIAFQFGFWHVSFAGKIQHSVCMIRSPIRHHAKLGNIQKFTNDFFLSFLLLCLYIFHLQFRCFFFFFCLLNFTHSSRCSVVRTLTLILI